MIKSFSVTDIGRKRKMNQDYVFASDAAIGTLPNLYIVADGMGGHKAGDYASRFAVEETVQQVRAATGGSLRDTLDLALHVVNEKLHVVSTTKEAYEGCGTTIVVCSVGDGVMHVANVGDSRLYVIGDTIRQITVDHSLVQEMILAGSLDEKKARNHPDKNVITRAVGAEDYIDVDFFNSDLHRGDIVLMCTDGLTNMVENEEIFRIVKTSGTLEERAHKLIDTANENGGLDNVSALLIDPFAD
ncbi:protein phosphatase [Lachnospiraceae bacterium NK3A20]|jgi:serine/threonine protein phosphatase PrpC|nr:protein phosphatase [Lachnospiraceae bacterium NK3A20]